MFPPNKSLRQKSEIAGPARQWPGEWTAALLPALAGLFMSGCYHVWKPLPEGLDFAGQPRPADQVRLLTDETYVDAQGSRRLEQQIFDEVFRLIRQARRLVVVDMFLFNEFVGAGPAPERSLCRELTDCLIEQKRRHPQLEAVLITDPVNTVYGGQVAPHLEALRQAGVTVVVTDLDRLRDSNPLWSSPWRLLVKPFGNAPTGRWPNPFGDGQVSLRSWLRLLNFKANHRKVLVVDTPAGLAGLVTSANPHDGSSAHGNVALVFDGLAAFDLLLTECVVLRFSQTASPRLPPVPAVDAESSQYTVRVLTEKAIKQAALAELASLGPGDAADLVMFYLADRELIRALRQAQTAGATLRIVLDPNKDAFGRVKNGLPNRQVARELARGGLAVRWAATHGEQAHAKLLLVRRATGRSAVLLGSANFTRRNLDNLNLETNVLLQADSEAPAIRDARDYVDRLWTNRHGHLCTTDYETYRDESWRRYWQYRFMEATGLCTW